MAPLTTFKFSKENNTYKVNIDLDDQMIIANVIKFDVTAEITNSEGESHSTTLQIHLNWEEQFGLVLHANKDLYRFEFREIGVQIDPLTGEETIPGMDGDIALNDQVYDKIREGIGETVAEIIDAIPVPDPFFGCLIKASISSIVGQALTCNEMRNNYGEGQSRFRQIFLCLSKHTSGIAYRTLWRAARCFLRGGI